MKKIISALCIGILSIGLLGGCSKNVRNNTDELIMELREENKSLIEENEILSKKLQNANIEVENSRAGNLLRLELEKKFYHILRLMERNEIKELKTLVTENIVVEKNKIINQNGYKKEFSLPEGNAYYIPRYFSSHTEEEIKRFSTAYEIHHDDNSTYKGSRQVLYVGFKNLNGEWKLDSMEIDIN